MGNHVDQLKKLLGKPGARVAVSVNAVDFSTDLDRKAARLATEISDMESLGFKAEELDLRKFFGREGIIEYMRQYDGVWFSGGNVFMLAKAFRQSGFDKVLEQLVKTNQLVYAGYSAAFCVLFSSLRGAELVDDKDVRADGYEVGEVWDGFGLIDFYPIVHFRSDHPESADVEKEYNYVVSHHLPHKTFRDGDVYVVDGQSEQVLVDS